MTEREWQTIDSAPRDGTKLLLWDPEAHDRYIVARWVRDDRNRAGPFGPFVWVSGHLIYGEKLAERVPTHWMPLPEPPQ